MKKLFALSSVLVTLVGCRSARDSQDERLYADAISRAIQVSGQAHTETLFWSNVRAWPQKRSYVDVRREIERLGPADRQVRLEIGNANTNSYYVTWFAQVSSRISVVSNIFPNGELRSGSVAASDWEALVDFMAQRQSFAQCKSDLSVDDGSVYIGTFSEHGHVETMLVYGFVPPSIGPGMESFVQALGPCGQLIREAYRVTKAALK
jgi:hypothetical protein